MPVSSPIQDQPPVHFPNLWQPAFENKLRSAVGKSLKIQKSAIHEIVTIEPRLSEAIVVSRFVHAILKRAGHLSLERRESAIRQVLEMAPSLSRDEVIDKLNQLAVTSLPAWASSSFWSRNIDPVLLRAIANTNEELEAAVRQILTIYPDLSPSQIRDRHARYRSKQSKAKSVAISENEWPAEADRLMRAAIAAEVETERGAIRRVSQKYPEIRGIAIEERFRKLQRRVTANGKQRYQRIAWSSEIDTRLLEAAGSDLFHGTVAEIAAAFSCSRECVYWHCEQHLGIARRKRPKAKPWDAADVRYLLDYMNEKNLHRIANALQRSYWSVFKKVRELGGNSIVPRYSLRDLRRELHVSHARLAPLIEQGQLKVAIANRQLKRGQQQYVLEEDLLRFLEEHAQELDLARVDATAKIRVLVDEVLAKERPSFEHSHAASA